MVEIKVHPFDTGSEEIENLKTFFYNGKKTSNKTSQGAKLENCLLDFMEEFQINQKKKGKEQSEIEPRLSVDTLFKKLKETIMQSEQSWGQIIKKLDEKQLQGHGDHVTISFNEFLRLLEQESYFRDIMFEYQLFFKSTKRLRFHKEVHLTGRKQGQYGENGIKGIPQALQAAHLIDNIIFFESNGVNLILCTFENKDVHAIDYNSGDILHQFIFKDDTIQSNAIVQKPHFNAMPTMNKDFTNAYENLKRHGINNRLQSVKQIVKVESESHRDEGQGGQLKRRDIMGNFRANITKKLAETVKIDIAEDLNKPHSAVTTQRSASRKARRHVSKLPSPVRNPIQSQNNSPQGERKRKHSVRILSQSQHRSKPYGILGLDRLDADEKMGAYKSVISTQQKGGKMLVTREFAYGIDEKLYTSESDRDKAKNRFYSFMKKIDLDIKLTDAHLAEMKSLQKSKTQALSSIFMRKNAVNQNVNQNDETVTNDTQKRDTNVIIPKPQENKLTDAELEVAIQQIIKKQEIRKQEQERFRDAREKFNLIDNEETHKLLKTFDKLTTKNALIGMKSQQLKKLNERGARQLQAMHAADGDQLIDQNATKSSLSTNSNSTVTTSLPQVSQLARAIGNRSPTSPHMNFETPGQILMRESAMHYINNKIHEMAGLPHSIPVKHNFNKRGEIITPSSPTHRDPEDIDEDKNHGFKIDTDKVSQPICVQHYKPLELIAFALVNRQLQIFGVRKTVAKLVFEQKAQIRTEQMAVCMSVNQHKVTEKLLICIGFQYDLLNVYEFDQSNRFAHRIITSLNSPYSQITNSKYIREIGLVLTTYTGYMEIFDNCDLKSIWSNKEEMQGQKGRGKMSVTHIDYSEKMDLIAFSGGQGKLGVLDGTSKMEIGLVQAHPDEIVNVSFYDQELQIITVSLTCQVGIWDAQKLEQIQIIRDQKQAVLHNALSSCFFYKPQGKLILATTKIHEWSLKVDNDVQIEVQKQDIIAQDYIKDLITQLKSQRKVGRAVFEKAREQIEIKNPNSKQIRQQLLKLQTKELQKQGYNSDDRYNFMKSFLRQSISQKISSYASVDKNESVLPSPLTRMVNLFIDESMNTILTIDTDALVRVWSMETGDCIGSFPIDQGASEDELHALTFEKKKLTGCNVDAEFKHIVVAFEGGKIQVNNLHSGSLIFNETENTMLLDNEVSELKFFPENCNFWFVAGCWEGRVAFFQESQMQRGRSFVKFVQSKGSHQKDVISLDVSEENAFATASIDNVISFWNTYQATESKCYKMPRSLVQPEINQNVQSIRFLRGKLTGYLLIVINTGELYIMDCLKMHLLNFEDGKDSCIQGRATEYPSIDLKDTKFLSISESGLGRIQTITKKSEGSHRLFNIKPYQEDFRVMPSGQLRADPKTCVIRARFSKKQDIFIVAQLNGRVSIFKFDNEIVTRMGILNSNEWPTSAEERRLAAREAKNQLRNQSANNNQLLSDDEKKPLNIQVKRLNKARIISVPLTAKASSQGLRLPQNSFLKQIATPQTAAQLSTPRVLDSHPELSVTKHRDGVSKLMSMMQGKHELPITSLQLKLV